MATKAILKSGNVRVQFRPTGLKIISQTFQTEQEADSYQASIQSGLNSIEEALRAKLPVDMAALFHRLHPDLQKRVRLLPAFAKVLGEISTANLTLGQLIDEFMRQYQNKDQNILSRLKWWYDHYGHLSISQMSEEYVRHGLNTLLTVGTSGKRPVSAQTTNRFKANLSSVFEFGKSRYHLKDNPCRHIKAKPEGKGRKRYLTSEEQQRLLIAAKHSKWDKFYLLILMAITTGARRGELAKLQWSDIDIKHAKITFRDTKNNSDKTIPLMLLLVDELKKHREIGTRLVFGNPRKPDISYEFREEWIVALKLADIDIIDAKGEKLVFHSLRHTFCSSLANTGAELHEIASLAGHKSIQTTMRYTHTNSTRLASVVNNTFNNLGVGPNNGRT
jgi:integrase